MILTNSYSRVAVFDTNFNITGESERVFNFNVGNVPYKVLISSTDTEGSYYVAFTNDTSIRFEDLNVNPFKVMSGVVQAIREFAKTHDVRRLEFVAGDETRSRLYSTMIKRFMPGAKYHIEDREFIVDLPERV